MNRRGFLKTLGLGAVAAVVPKQAEPQTQKVQVKIEYVKLDEPEIYECDGPGCPNYFCDYSLDPHNSLPFGWCILKDETKYEHFLCSMECAENWSIS